MLDAITQDVRYAARGLRAKPGFTAAVVITLALGIGANAAIFSIVDRLLFRPPPMLAHPDLTHRVYLTSMFRGKENRRSYIQYARYVDFTKWTRSFAQIAQVRSSKLAIGTGDEAREMNVSITSASFFSFFDAPPALGRYFSAAEDTPPNGTAVAVLGYGFWQTRYGGRTDVLGEKLQIGPLLYTIIGVAPRGFVGLWPSQPPVAFIPITTYAGSAGVRLGKGENWWTTYHWTFSETIAERKPGVSIATANADLSNAYRRSYDAELAGSPRQTPAALAKPHASVESILSERGPNKTTLAKVATLITGMALIVLLIACANVANLLLARALRRRREIAVRLALGVSRARLLSQLMTESVLLALMGGIAGVFVGQLGGSFLRSLFLPEGAETSVIGDTRTLMIAGLGVLLAGVLTGLAPALQAGRVELTNDLRSGAREGTYHRSRLRVALLVLQGSLSVVLLVGAGLFVRSLQNVKSVRLGYDVDPVLIVNLNMRGVKLDSVRDVALRQQLLETAQSIPGVEHAALNVTIPFWSTWSMDLRVAGIDSVNKLGEFDLNAVSPDYFATLGTRIIRGRGISASDVANAPGAMVVSEAMARVLWPGKDALGQCIRINADTVPCTYVVGIAENIKSGTLSDEPSYFYYLSAAQFNPNRTGLFVRTRGDASRQADAIRRELQRLMPPPAYITVTPFTEVMGQQTRSWKLGATMFVVFGLLALTLAAVGLYSVIAYNVVQRTHEMGVRIALGAQVRDVVKIIVGQGLRHGVAGIFIGGLIAFAAARWVKPLLFAESPRDPLVYVAVTTVLLVVAITASWIPARRAARVDPNVALRSE
ncbi:MAG TPA: ABC transporter permease [Gemmatimonadaceae bacterium]|nr:ABC transporter permease [Gemmatimonadaceae bacterium]